MLKETLGLHVSSGKETVHAIGGPLGELFEHMRKHNVLPRGQCYKTNKVQCPTNIVGGNSSSDMPCSAVGSLRTMELALSRGQSMPLQRLANHMPRPLCVCSRSQGRGTAGGYVKLTK